VGSTFAHTVLLLFASCIALLPLLWRKQSNLFDPIVLFGATVFVWGFGKYVYLTFSKPIDGLPVWGVANELQNGVLATSAFCIAAGIAYFLLKAGFPAGTPRPSPMPVDMRIIYTVSIILSLISFSAFIAILNSPNLSISWELISAKRFLDSDLGPAARVGSLEYILYKATLMARVPLYAVLVGVLLRRKANIFDIVILVANFVCIFAVAFVFSNRFNLLLGFVDMVAIIAVIVGRLFSPRLILLGLAVFASMIVASELRMGEGRDRSILEHIYEGRYFADVERTDKVVDYYVQNDRVHGQTLYGWVYILVPSSYGDRGESFLNMGWNIGYHVFGMKLSGVPPGFVGELFMNFGWAGVLFGGVFFGAVAAYIGMRMYDKSHVTWLAVLLALSAVRLGLVLFNGNFGTAIIKILLEVGPAAALIWLATRVHYSALAGTPAAQQN